MIQIHDIDFIKNFPYSDFNLEVLKFCGYMFTNKQRLLLDYKNQKPEKVFYFQNQGYDEVDYELELPTEFFGNFFENHIDTSMIINYSADTTVYIRALKWLYEERKHIFQHLDYERRLHAHYLTLLRANHIEVFKGENDDLEQQITNRRSTFLLYDKDPNKAIDLFLNSDYYIKRIATKYPIIVKNYNEIKWYYNNCKVTKELAKFKCNQYLTYDQWNYIKPYELTYIVENFKDEELSEIVRQVRHGWHRNKKILFDVQTNDNLIRTICLILEKYHYKRSETGEAICSLYHIEPGFQNRNHYRAFLEALTIEYPKSSELMLGGKLKLED